MRGRALSQLFDGLGQGDPVAWAFVGVFVVLAAGFGLAIFFVKRKFKREDEARAKRYGRS